MSNFEVSVVTVADVQDHPNADRLSIVSIGDFLCISAKLEDGSHRYKNGEPVVYIPEGSIIPEWMLKKMGFWNGEENQGTLYGANHNIVKAMKLRGIVSRGILYPTEMINDRHYISKPNNSFLGLNDLVEVSMGQDVQAILGVSKHEPPVPQTMRGEVTSIGERSFKYDIENYEKYPDVFNETDIVVATSKRHGTFCCFGFLKNYQNKDLLDGNIFAASKGLFGQGLVFKNNKTNETNIYMKMLCSKNKDGKPIHDVLKELSTKFENQSVFIIGEIFGNGIQDLKYEQPIPVFEVFDIYVGEPHNGRFLSDIELDEVCLETIKMNRVPVLYRGNFNKTELKLLRDQNDVIDDKPINQIREGIVIRSSVEDRCFQIGRKQLKMVSPNYLLRKNKDATEWN